MGGGCNRSYGLLSLTVVVALIAIPFFSTFQTEAVDPDDVFTADAGDGTPTNPFSGTLTSGGSMLYMVELPEEIYVMVGTVFYEVWLVDEYQLMPAHVEGDDVGIDAVREYSNRSMHLWGTADAVGTCEVYFTPMGGEKVHMFTVHIVDAAEFETLTFESDPIWDAAITFIDRT